MAGTVTGLMFATLGPTALVINWLFRPVAMAATMHFVVLAIALRRNPPAIASAQHDRAERSPGERPDTDTTGTLPV